MERYAAMLAKLDAAGRRRSLQSAGGVDFTSNDYLALASSLRLRQAIEEALARGVPVGAGASRLLRGNHPEHVLLETEAAEFFGAERALLFGSGYAANNAVFATLPQADDLVVYDSLVHASVHDGMKLGRAAITAFPHNDVGAAEDAIRKWRSAGGRGRSWIAIESLYSMDGDFAPLESVAQLARRTDGVLVIDEAHATGVYGRDGRGLASALEGQPNVLTLHTGGKALGVGGGIVTCGETLADFLVNRSRAFIFATAPSPLLAAALRESLRILQDEPERRERLGVLARHANDCLARVLGDRAATLRDLGSQILPVIIGEDAAAVRVAQQVQARGWDVRAIRPPTVPSGTARLRISISLHVDEDAISGMAEAVRQALEEED